MRLLNLCEMEEMVAPFLPFLIFIPYLRSR